MTCDKCDLHKTRKNIVRGYGNKYSSIMFIGEAPGYHEDIQGKPFVGPAGKVFDSLLSIINLDRDDIYLTNVVKCRPPNNRDPTDNEISICSKFLDIELGMVKPKIIVPMGRFATEYVLTKHNINFSSMGKSHGLPILIENTVVIPIFHPAAIIYNKYLKQTAEKDMKRIGELINDTKGNEKLFFSR